MPPAHNAIFDKVTRFVMASGVIGGAVYMLWPYTPAVAAAQKLHKQIDEDADKVPKKLIRTYSDGSTAVIFPKKEAPSS